MAAEMKCPACRRALGLTDNALGKPLKCPECGHLFQMNLVVGSKSDSGAPPTKAATPVVRPQVAAPGPAPSPKDGCPKEPPSTMVRAPVARPRPEQPEPEPGPPPPSKERAPLSNRAVLAITLVGLFLFLVPVLGGGGLVRWLLQGRGTGPGPLTSTNAPTKERAAPGPEPVPEPVVEQKGSFDTVPPPSPVAPPVEVADATPTAPAPDVSEPPAVPAAPPTPDPEGPRRAMTTADIVEESEPSIALVRGTGSSGTGFLVGTNLLVTNAHVIDDAFLAHVTVTFPSPTEALMGPYTAELLWEDTRRDLACLKLETALPPLRVAGAYKFRKGEDITVIGCPGIGENQVLMNAVSRGVMSTQVSMDEKDFYQLGIAINPGNSGGPVFDSSGSVIGVATLKSIKQESLAHCAPVEDLWQALEQLRGLTPPQAKNLRSRHRLIAAVKGLGGGGAIFCMGIDARRSEMAGRVDMDERANLDKPVKSIAQFSAVSAPSLLREVPELGKDASLEGPTCSRVTQLGENFQRLKKAYEEIQRHFDSNDLLRMKTSHRQWYSELSKDRGLKVPEKLLTAFDDHDNQQRGIVREFHLGPDGSFHERIIEGFGIPARPPGAGTSMPPRGPSRPTLGPRRQGR